MSSSIVSVVWVFGEARSHSGSGKEMKTLSILEERCLLVEGLEEKKVWSGWEISTSESFESIACQSSGSSGWELVDSAGREVKFKSPAR